MATPTNALHVALGRHLVTICHQFTALTRSACARAAYKKPLAGFEPAPQSISLPDDRGRKESALRIVSVTRVKCPPLCIELQRHINSPFLRWSAQGRAVIFGHTRGRLISTALAFRGLRLVESKSFGGILEKKVSPCQKEKRNPRGAPRMGTAASSRWFMGPCVHFGLRGRPVLAQMDGIKPPQHDACCWCCHFIHPHIKSHLHSIGRFSGARNTIKGNGEGRPNSSRKPSSPPAFIMSGAFPHCAGALMSF